MTNNNPSQQRRHHSPEEKVQILRRHLLEKVPISELCDQHHIHPTQFYQWQKQFFENGATAFVRSKPDRSANRSEQTIQALEDKLQRKDEVVSEIMEEMVRLKKELGEA